MPTVVYLLQSRKAQRLFWACSFSVRQSSCESGTRSPCFTEKILVCREKTALEPPLQIHLHCSKNLKQIFSEMKLLSLGPSFYIHVSGSDLYIPTICLFWNLIPSLNKKIDSSYLHLWYVIFQFGKMYVGLYVNSRINPRSGEFSLAVQQYRDSI